MSEKEVLKEVGAPILHCLIAMLVLAPVVFCPGAWKILGGAASGYLMGWIREDAQHRTPDTTPIGGEGWGWWLKGLDKFSGRHRDMTAFLVGGLLDATIWYFTIGGGG